VDRGECADKAEQRESCGRTGKGAEQFHGEGEIRLLQRRALLKEPVEADSASRKKYFN